jgi:hypothetical protein
MNASAIADMLRRPVQSGQSSTADESTFALRQQQRQAQAKVQTATEAPIPQIFDTSAIQLDIDGISETNAGYLPQQPLIDISI